MKPGRRGSDALVRLLGSLVHPAYRDEVVGDLLEELETDVAARHGRTWSTAWLAVHLLRSAASSRWHGWRGRRGRSGRGNDPGRETTMEWDGMVQDLRFAVRSYRRTPIVAVVAILTLATGIGATLAISAVLNGVFLRPLPYPEADRLVHLEGQEGALFGLSLPYILTVERGSAALESVAVWQGWIVVLETPEGGLVRRAGASVSADYFDVVGADAALGRLFGPGYAAEGHPPAVVLSHATWLQDFGGDPDAVGRTLESGGVDYTVVGVAPEGFRDPIPASMGWAERTVWRVEPPAFYEARDDRGWIGFWAVGRLAAGRSAEDATASGLTAIADAFPDLEGRPSFAATTVREVVSREVRPTLLVLLGAVLVILLIGCANVANLMLSRATVRGREMAVRASLGAGRSRLVRQLFTESLVLAGVASALGLGAALLAARGIAALPGAALPDTTSIVLDVRVAAVAVALAAATSILFGFFPAVRATGRGAELAATLREGGRSGASRRSLRVRNLLVIAETGLAVVLLVAAGLLVRTFLELSALDPGFATEGAGVVDVGLPGERFASDGDQSATLDRLLAAAAAADVRSAGAITDLPMGGAVNSTRVVPAGEDPADPDIGLQTLVRAVSEEWFRTMEIPVVTGRAFEGTDAPGAEPVAVANRTFVQRMPGVGPGVGATVTVRGTPRRIVGVVADVTEFGLGDDPSPVLYEPYRQNVEAWMRERVSVVARVGDDEWTEADGRALRSRLREVDPRVTVGTPVRLADVVASDVAPPRFRAVLVGLFAVVALFLTGVGIAGVLAYTVSQRLPEMGLRMALGAREGDVVGMVVGSSARLAGAGVVLGLLAAALGTRLLRGFLWGVPPLDPLVFGAVAAILGSVAVASSWLPARRAASVDPAGSLHSE